MKITKLDENNWVSEDVEVLPLVEHLDEFLAQFLQSKKPLHVVMTGRGAFFPIVISLDFRLMQGQIQVLAFLSMDVPESQGAIANFIHNHSNPKTLEDVSAVMNFLGINNLQVVSIGPETDNQALLFSSM